jgi:hypothetical protein
MESGFMKGIIRRVLILAAILVAVNILQLPPSRSATIDLGVGESRDVGDDGLVVGFGTILRDSRCPYGVFCIWEGDAIAQIWADHPSETKTVVELHTHRDFEQEFDFGIYSIALTKVVPYPVYGEVIDPEDYVVVLTITGDSASPVENTTWSRIKALYE